MKVNFPYVKHILSTLPIGYYAGYRISAKLDEKTEKTNINLVSQNIVISFPMIQSAMENVDDERYLETCVRGLLYHEVSHALLTPKELGSLCHTKLEKWVLNVFEDQRIETILSYYFDSVDFKKNCEIINNWSELESKPLENERDAFFRAVRFNYGKKKWTNRVHELIQKYVNVNCNCRYYEIFDYKNDVMSLYYMIAEDFAEMDEDDIEKQDDFELFEGDTPVDDCDSDGHAMFHGTDRDAVNTIVKNALQKNASFLCSAQKDAEAISNIIKRFNRKNSGGSAVASYSGVINPRAVSRADYKYFDRRAEFKGTNKFGTVHLNLFLDESGSFHVNQNRVNMILYALSKIESANENFTYDIVYCGMGERIVRNKLERQMECHGGNNLDMDIFGIYRSLQKPNTYNYNIVLFDGDAFTDSPYHQRSEYFKNFGAFNNSNCTIISDFSNQSYINTYAKNARRIFTKDYVSELSKNILSTLDFAFR